MNLTQIDGMWESPGAEVVWETAGTHLEMTYIGRRQATEVQWVALRQLLEVYLRWKSY